MKKIFALILALASCLSLFGCKKDAAPAPTQATTKVTEATQGETVTQAPTQAPTAPPTEPVTTAVVTTAEPTTEAPTYSVPYVVGMTAQDAYYELNDAGVTYTVKREYSENVKPETVMGQEPEEGFVTPD